MKKIKFKLYDSVKLITRFKSGLTTIRIGMLFYYRENQKGLQKGLILALITDSMYIDYVKSTIINKNGTENKEKIDDEDEIIERFLLPCRLVLIEKFHINSFSKS